MTLKEIAKMAVAEAMGGATAEKLPDGVTMADNGDGTVTYSLAFSLDPKVQAEMSKAMPKGEKREDQVDKVGDAEAQDEAPKGVFAMALDEALGSAPSQTGDGTALDASPTSRHANTPLENCRAKDPMFCPYHGQAAIQKWVADELSKTVPNLLLSRQVTFDVVRKGKDFTVSITGPSSYNSSVFTAILFDLSSKNGIVQKSPIASDFGGGGRPQEHDVAISAAPDYDKESMLAEWADNLMVDVANDPQLQQEIDPKEFADFLGKLVAVGQAQSGTPAYDTALADAEKAYHMLRGQVEYKGVNRVKPLVQDSESAESKYRAASGDYHAAKSAVDAVKKVFFRNGKFPNGFAKANPFVAAYNAASQAVGYYAENKYQEAATDEKAFASTISVATHNQADVQRYKGLVSALKYGAENYGNAVKKYVAAQNTFMQELYDWAVNNQGKPNGPNMNDIQKAFPNGRPQ